MKPDKGFECWFLQLPDGIRNEWPGIISSLAADQQVNVRNTLAGEPAGFQRLEVVIAGHGGDVIVASSWNPQRGYLISVIAYPATEEVVVLAKEAIRLLENGGCQPDDDER